MPFGIHIRLLPENYFQSHHNHEDFHNGRWLGSQCPRATHYTRCHGDGSGDCSREWSRHEPRGIFDTRDHLSQQYVHISLTEIVWAFDTGRKALKVPCAHCLLGTP